MGGKKIEIERDKKERGNNVKEREKERYRERMKSERWKERES